MKKKRKSGVKKELACLPKIEPHHIPHACPIETCIYIFIHRLDILYTIDWHRSRCSHSTCHTNDLKKDEGGGGGLYISKGYHTCDRASILREGLA